MFVLALLALGRAGTAYICDCEPGADVDCVPGDDGTPGTSASIPWRSVELGRLEWNDAVAGDAVLFCQGGAFAIESVGRWTASGCTAEKPCTIGSYAPPWGSGDESRPILSVLGDLSAFRFDDSGEARHQEGAQLRGLHLVCTECTDTGGRGVILGNDIDDVAIEDMEVEGFDIGIAVAGSTACAKDDPACDGRSTRVAIRTSAIHDNLSFGITASGDELVIEDNVLADNGHDALTDHNLAIDSAQSPDANVQVVGNQLHGSVPDDDESCRTAEIQVEGVHAALRIVGNGIVEKGAVADACWGISVAPDLASRPERFDAATIKNNVVRNAGAVGIGLASCASCVVENNLVVWDGSDRSVRGIVAPAVARAEDDDPLNAIWVRNNTIVTASPGSGIEVGDEGEGHVVVSNAVLYTGSSPDWNCFDANLPTSSYEAFDYDLCWFPDAAGEWNDGWGAIPDPLSAWQGGSGLCTHCLDVDPGLDGGAPIDETSAVVGAGHPTLSSLDDILGRPRIDPDVGAYEWTLPQDTGDTGEEKKDDTAAPADSGPDEEESDDDGGCNCAHGGLAVSWLWVISGLVVLRRRR
jgi:uncharacterized protein (TIGR03382 family)